MKRALFCGYCSDDDCIMMMVMVAVVVTMVVILNLINCIQLILLLHVIGDDDNIDVDDGVHFYTLHYITALLVSVVFHRLFHYTGTKCTFLR